MQLAPGTKLGPYEIAAPLGAGGMGEVYRAHDIRLGRDVAIKVLPAHLSASPEVRARFEREARAVSSLNHPHICTLFDIGREGDTDFLVMELIEGETLAQRLKRGALPPPDVLKIGAGIADALARAHRASIVHRDLKPANVMLTKSGAKLMDFGLARATKTAGGSGSDAVNDALTQSPTLAEPLTAEGTIVGTFQYMAPEQLEGKEADHRSDVWALGCVLYEMATGEPPFVGKSQASLIAAIMERPPQSMVELVPTSPPMLDRLVRACLSKDPDDRIQTAHDVSLQLDWMRTESSTGGAAVPAAARPRRRTGWARWLVLSIAAIAVAGTAFVAGRRSEPQAVSREVQFHRKTYSPQSIFTARFMPDGKTLVMSASLEGNAPGLFVIRPEYPEPQALGMENVHLLAISSRGELAVLNRARYSGHHRLFYGTLARMPLEGGAPRDLLDHVREADWSPDGNDLAIIREVNDGDQLEFPIGNVLHRSAGYLSDVRVSHRGDRIAFMEHPSRFDDRGSVQVVDLEGHAREMAGGYWGMEGLAWSPNDDAVYFSATVGGSDFSVYRADIAGGARLDRQSAGLLTIQDVAPDGTWVVTRDETPSGIVFRKAGGKAEVDLTWLDSGIRCILSGDGETLMFTDQSEAGGPNYSVTLRPTSGGAIVRLGEGTGHCFSVDGRSVLSVVPSTPPRIMSYPIGAGQTVRLDHGQFENLSNVNWAPDGKHVLVSGNLPGQPRRCFLLDAATGEADPVGPDGTWDGMPSPDGKSFAARTQSGWSVFPLSGSNEGRPVPSATPRDYLIRWSPDARAIYTYRRAEIPATLDRIDVTTGSRETVTTLGDSRAGLLSIVNVSMADDMQSVAYATWNYTSVLYTVSSGPE